MGHSTFKNVIEPAFIVALFTTGCLINRRRGGFHPHDEPRDDIETGDRYANASPPLKPVAMHTERPVRRSPNILFSLVSRFFNTFPFLIEIWYWLLTYWPYQLLRAFSARMIAHNEPIFRRAQDHALSILRVENLLGVDIEQRFQAYIMTQQPWLMPILANIYYLHISVGISFLVYVYTALPPSTFQRIRRTIAVDNYISFVIVTLWRCYPPRLLPAEYGYVDVLHSKAAGAPQANAWNNNRFQLTIAAMPSLHFGTALFFAVTLVRFSPHRPVRLLAPLWPAAMLITIVATANHFLADALVGAFVPYLGWRFNHIVLLLKPLHDWVFSPLTSRLDLVGYAPRSAPKAL